MLPPGATVVPIIGISDQTNLTNFSRDKKAWPVYLTIGDLPSARRNSLGSMAVLLLALLPIPPKLSKFSKADQRQRKINADTLQDVFELIFAPVQGVAHSGVPMKRGHSVGRRILRLRPHRRLKVEVRIKIKIKIIQSRIKQ